MCERMSAFGIIYNLVTFLVGNLHLSRAYSANMVTNMLGTSFVTCLLGGYVADTWLGRFLTISTFGVIQFLVSPLMPQFLQLQVRELVIRLSGRVKCKAMPIAHASACPLQ